MKKLITVLILSLILTTTCLAEESNLYQDEPGGYISIEGDLTPREDAVWDLLELNFIMEVSDIEDIFRLEDDIHQFDDLSDIAVRELETIVRSYVLYHTNDNLVPIREEDLPDDLK